jgi:hypothetical protein
MLACAGADLALAPARADAVMARARELLAASPRGGNGGGDDNDDAAESSRAAQHLADAAADTAAAAHATAHFADAADAAARAAADAAAASAWDDAAAAEASDDDAAVEAAAPPPPPPMVLAPFEELPSEAMAESAESAAAPLPALAHPFAAAAVPTAALRRAPPSRAAADVASYMSAFADARWAGDTQRSGNGGDAAAADAPKRAMRDAAADSAAEPTTAALADAAQRDVNDVAAQLSRGMASAERAARAASEAADAADAAIGRSHHHLEKARRAVAAHVPIDAPAAAPAFAAANAAAAAADALAADAAAAEAAAMAARAEAALDAIYSPSDEGIFALDALALEAQSLAAESAPLLPRGAATAPPLQMTPLLPVAFELPLRVRYGERVALCGSGAALGSWDVRAAVPLAWSDGDTWRSSPLLLPADGTFSYKYVVLGGDGTALTWQKGTNSVLMLCEADAPCVRVRDSWTGNPLEARTLAGPEASRGGDAQRGLAPSERLEAVAAVRAAALRKAQARADAAMRALAAERLAVRALRAEAGLAAGVREQLRALLDAERRRSASLARQMASFTATLQKFKAQASSLGLRMRVR